jgi:hypothetical protein
MSNRGGQKRQTFAQIVAGIEETAPAGVEPVAVTPGKFSGETLFDLSGNRLTEVDGRSLQADEVRAAVLKGAVVVWDQCGCGGYCNALIWPDAVELRREAVRSAPRPRKNNRDRVTRLVGAGGEVLMIAGGYRWGDLLR